jgi:hypothetical protein
MSQGRRIGHKLFEVRARDPSTLASDILPPAKLHLSNRSTAGFLRDGATDVTWLSGDPNHADNDGFRGHAAASSALLDSRRL